MTRGTTALLIGIAAAALAVRAAQLARRPLHHDEANQAVRTGILLDSGLYRYDPQEHHGPTLYYMTLPFAWLAGAERFSQTEEWMYRIVPAVFGAAVILLLLGLRDGLGGPAIFAAALLTAVSPAMVFFSRYYVQESQLVFFTCALVAAGWRCVQTRRPLWAAAAGASAGLMHATKETCVLAFACLLLAWLLTVPGKVTAALLRERGRRGAPALALVAAGAAVFASVMLFSCFFTYWQGPVDSVRAYFAYLGRGAGLSTEHTHPWDYYLRMLAGVRYSGGPLWTEALVLGLAAIGLSSAALRRPSPPDNATRLRRFLAVYAALITVLYSLISYKTPWCVLTPLHALILLAGVGASTLWDRARGARQRTLIVLLLGAGILHLGVQAYRASFTFYRTDPRNPYVYAHTSADFLNLVRRIEAVASLLPEGHATPVQVLTSPQDAWPLPWYLRRFTAVGYWTRAEDLPPDTRPPMLVVAPSFEESLPPRLREGYQPTYYGLRPGALLALYVREDVWARFLRAQPSPPHS